MACSSRSRPSWYLRALMKISAFWKFSSAAKMRDTSTFSAFPSSSDSYSLRRFSSPSTWAASLIRANSRSLTSFRSASDVSVTVSG